MRKDTVDKLLSQWRAERPDLDVSALGVAIRIEMLAKLMRRGTARNLARVGLKPWEYDVLSALRRQGEPYQLPATELARASLLTAGAMTTRIDQLEGRQLVRREPDPDDRRGILVSLTRKGQALVDRAIEVRLSAAESGTECLGRRERGEAEAALRQLLLSFEAADESRPAEGARRSA
jgi:DNA-binding MarR family transcriptional regulator